MAVRRGVNPLTNWEAKDLEKNHVPVPEGAVCPPIEIPELPCPPGFEAMPPERQRQVNSMLALGANTAIFHECERMQRKRVRERCTTDQWLDENEREWLAMDKLMASRPWATNKDKVFAYPFKEATDAMREAEGPWVGDETPFAKEWTRGVAPSECITQVFVPVDFPPRFRIILFTPEFGSTDSFCHEDWLKIDPEAKTDLWVVSWQGWSNFEEMIDQVTRKVLSFGDSASSVWYGHGYGAIVAYEVLKRYEGRFTPGLPTAIVVGGCPAPHLFPESYKPHEKYEWLAQLRIASDFDILTAEQKEILRDQFQVAMELDEEQQAAMRRLKLTGSAAAQKMVPTDLSAAHKKALMGDLQNLQSYTFDREDDQKKVKVPLLAVGHDEDELVETEALEAWEEYSPEGKFELLSLEEHEDTEMLAELGHGFSKSPPKSMLKFLRKTLEKYEIIKDLDKILPDVGPLDLPLPDEIDCVVVGAGIAGVNEGRALTETGKSVIIIDRYDKVGGIWIYYANVYSRVNSSEPAYRIVHQEGPNARPNEDHSPTHDILRDIYTVAAMYCHGKFRMSWNVVKVVQRPDKSYDVHCEHTKTGEKKTVHTGVVAWHVNRRIGKRRDVVFEGEKNFRGDIVYGYANEVLGLQFWGKRVIVIGGGAFAFENMRTALEHGAKFVTMLARRAGSTCPKWIDMIAFLRPCDEFFNTNKNGNIISFDVWRKCYENAGIPVPGCWAEGLLKPHNHTISVSDLVFIAGYHGLADLKVGEIAKFRPDGQGVIFTDGTSLDCDIVIKATGFHLNDEVPKITGIEKLFSFNMLAYNMGYGAEPLLDGAQFGSAKGRVAEDNDEITEEELVRGMLQMQRLGLPDVRQRNNPFGSSYVGPMFASGWFMKWLVQHPKEQEDLIAAAGEPTQHAVQFWSSQIGNGNITTIKKLIVGLSKTGTDQQLELEEKKALELKGQ